jgi:transcriptional regulator with XRE-family HTH domain
MQDTQDVDQDYEEFLKLVADRIKTLRLERGLSLRDMVVTHGYHDSNYRRIEREGAGGVQSLLRICKAFDISLSSLLDGLGLYPKENLKEIGERVAAEEHAALMKNKAWKQS